MNTIVEMRLSCISTAKKATKDFVAFFVFIIFAL